MAQPLGVKEANGALTPDPKNWRPKIKRAALDLFRRYGIRKTTVDEIAKAAGVSRPSFYRFYKDRQQLLLAIANEEVGRLAENIRGLQDQINDIDDLFTEAILAMVLDCEQSEVVQFLLDPENEDISIELTDNDTETWRILEAGWSPLLKQAQSKGRLREPAEVDEIVRWITSTQVQLLARVRAVHSSPDQLRVWISRFVVPSILKDLPSN